MARRLDGTALRSARRDERETLRCSACGEVCTATLPAAAGAEQDRARARAVWAIGRYALGLPLSRVPGDQAMLGVPVPEATPWDQIEQVGDWSSGVCASLERLAAQGELSSQDDPAGRRLALRGENRTARAAAEALGFARSTERTGRSTTAWVVQGGEQTICLYEAGRAQAGDNLTAVLGQRQAAQDTPRVRSDALSRHEADAMALMRCHCLAHGRRQCRARADLLPQERAVGITARTQVVDHDDQARDAQRSPAARFASHQTSRRPSIDALTGGLDKPCDERLVEPTSALGKALASLPGHGETLTRFVSVVGAPRDTHLVERALKLCLRQRKHALFSQTESSASLARVLTSLMATCLHAGVNALDALVAWHEHRQAVCTAPEAWLPWPSQARLAPPEATRRQSCAMCARSGAPFHRTMSSSRADRGPRASAVLGPQVKRPCENRCRHSQSP